MSGKALEGVKVIEIADTIGTAYVGRIMAMAGAEVIRVEAPDGSSWIRNQGPFAGKEKHIEKSIPHLFCNPNKKSVTIDITKPEGIGLLKKLLAGADILLREGIDEDYAKMGLGWKELHKQFPKLIVSAVSPFGEEGLYKRHKANPINISHQSGTAALNPHGMDDFTYPPTMAGGNFEEYDLGTIMLIGVLVALYYQRMAGKGQYVPISADEAYKQIGHTEATVYPVFNFYHTRAGLLTRAISSLPVKCKDGYIQPFLVQQHEVNAMAKLIGKEEWLEEEWFKDPAKRRAKSQVLADAMAEYFKDYTMKEISDRSQELGASLSPMYSPQDIVDTDEQFAARGFFTEMEHPDIGKFKYPGRPFLLSETPFELTAHPPLLGQHNEEVFAGIGADTAGLKQQGII